MRMILRAALLSLAFGVALIAGQLSDTFTDWLDHPAIQYATRPVSDPVAGAESEAVGTARSSSRSTGRLDICGPC